MGEPVREDGPQENWVLDYAGYWRDTVLKDFVKNAVQVGLGTFLLVAFGVISPTDAQARALVLVLAALYVPSVLLLVLSAVLDAWQPYLLPLLVTSGACLVAMFGIGLTTESARVDEVALLGVGSAALVGVLYGLVVVVRAVVARDLRALRPVVVGALQAAALVLVVIVVFRVVDEL